MWETVDGKLSSSGTTIAGTTASSDNHSDALRWTKMEDPKPVVSASPAEVEQQARDFDVEKTVYEIHHASEMYDANSTTNIYSQESLELAQGISPPATIAKLEKAIKDSKLEMATESAKEAELRKIYDAWAAKLPAADAVVGLVNGKTKDEAEKALGTKLRPSLISEINSTYVLETPEYTLVMIIPSDTKVINHVSVSPKKLNP